MCMFVCAYRVYIVSMYVAKAVGEVMSPWNWSYRHLWGNSRVVSTEPKSSAEAEVLLTSEPSLRPWE